MPGPAQKRLLQVHPRVARKPRYLYQTLCLQAGEGCFDALLFTRNIQIGDILRVGRHAQNGERGVDSQRLERLGNIEIAHNGGVVREAEILLMAGIVEELPGEGRQLWRLDAQFHSQTLALVSGDSTAYLVQDAYFSREQGCKQRLTELLYGLLTG